MAAVGGFLAAYGGYIAAASAAVGAASSYAQAKQQKASGEYSADLAEANIAATQQQTERDAQIVLQQGAQEEASFRKKARAQFGTNIANIAKSGMSMTGSPLLVMNEIAEQTEQEAYGIRRSSIITADNIKYGGEMSTFGLNQSAKEARISGKYNYQQGLIGAGATLMQGASSLYKPKNPKITSYSSKMNTSYSGM